MSVKNHTDLNADIDSVITNNNNGDITGPILNQQLKDVADSAVNKLDYANDLPKANTITTGLLNSTDWNIFNNKQDTLVNADLTHTGKLTSTDWSTFNSKQNALIFDTIPTIGSFNPVYSDGIYNAITAALSGSPLSTKTLYINSVSGVDPTGVNICHTQIQSGLDNASYSHIIFDGVYRIQAQLNIPTGKKVTLRSGTSVRIYQNVAAGSISCFGLNTFSGIELEAGSELTVETASTVNYIGIQIVNGSYGWTIEGRGKIRGFGRHGILVASSVSPPNQYFTGLIKDVVIRDIQAATGSFGDGIKISNGTEYVHLDCIDVSGCAANGVYIDRGANNSITGGRSVGNTGYGLRVVGASAGNTDHLHVTGFTMNHNTAGSFIGLDIKTGVNFSGCDLYGSKAFDITNCKGVTFNGCGLALDVASNVVTGASGRPILVNGGHGLGTTQATFLSTLTGGGTVTFNNVAETA